MPLKPMLIEFPSHQGSLRHLVLQAKRYAKVVKDKYYTSERKPEMRK
jgi:hypothetical protein